MSAIEFDCTEMVPGFAAVEIETKEKPSTIEYSNGPQEFGVPTEFD